MLFNLYEAKVLGAFFVMFIFFVWVFDLWERRRK